MKDLAFHNLYTKNRKFRLFDKSNDLNIFKSTDRSIDRKSIAKSKFRYRKSLSNYKKLNFVAKGNLETLHKKLGLMS